MSYIYRFAPRLLIDGSFLKNIRYGARHVGIAVYFIL